MSTLKKGLAILLAVVMALALAVPALADEPKGSLTINLDANEPHTGEVFTVYRVMDLTTNGAGGYSYTVNSSFQKFFNDAFTVAQTADVNTPYKDATNATQVYNYIKSRMPEGDAGRNARRTFSAELADYVTRSEPTISAANSATVGANATSVKISNLPYGWYLVIPTLSNAEGTNTDPLEGIIMFQLDTVDNDVVVTDKLSFPTPSKTVTDNDEIEKPTNIAAIGDTLTFKITGQMPNMNGYKTFKFIVNDTLSKMGYVANSSKIAIGNATMDLTDGENQELTIPKGNEVIKLGYDLKIESDANNNTQITLTFKNLKPGYGSVAGEKVFTAGTRVVFSYNATVLSDAVIGGAGNDNKVTFSYSNNPNADTTSTSVSTKTTTFVLGLKLMKVNNGDQKLSGSEFVLQKKTGNGDDDFTTVYSTNGKDSNGVNDFTNPTGKIQFSENDSVNNAEDMQKENFTFSGLDKGTYRLYEIVSPDGYVKITDPILFTIDAKGQIDSTSGTSSLLTLTETTSKGNEHISSKDTNKSTGYVTLHVKNTTQSELPSTGGAGLYIVAGVAIVALLGFGGTAMLKRKVNGEN